MYRLLNVLKNFENETFHGRLFMFIIIIFVRRVGDGGPGVLSFIAQCYNNEWLLVFFLQRRGIKCMVKRGRNLRLQLFTPFEIPPFREDVFSNV